MPGGNREISICLHSKGTFLSGTVEGPFGKYNISNGNFSRNNVTWTINLKSNISTGPEENRKTSRDGLLNRIGRFLSESFSGPPLGLPRRIPRFRPMKDMIVEFDARINGEEIIGDMKFGPYATGKFRGKGVNHRYE
ncbi:MAG: hypothetical protein JW712_07115 [Dehalococcoidales bacterium]|nr:hypothetical protein [Dehalococcoidales bacterium]